MFRLFCTHRGSERSSSPWLPVQMQRRLKQPGNCSLKLRTCRWIHNSHHMVCPGTHSSSGAARCSIAFSRSLNLKGWPNRHVPWTKNVRALDMMTVIGQVVALGHLVAQFVEEAQVEHFVRFCSLAGYHFKIASQERVVADYVDPMWRIAFPSRPSRSPAPTPVLEPGQLVVLPGREDYLAYLKENELSEDSVLGIVPKLDAERRRKVNQVLMTALDSGYESLVQSVERASASNTNVLLAEINRRLVLRFAEHAVVAAKNVYAGVFPTNTFNAHVVYRGAQPLILVNTGAFELLEGAIVPFSVLKPGSARQQARVLAGFVRNTVRRVLSHVPISLKTFKLTRNGGSLGCIF